MRMSKGSSSTLIGRRELLLIAAVLAAAFIAIGYQVERAYATGTFAFQNATSQVVEGEVVCINVVRTGSATGASTVSINITGASLADLGVGGTEASTSLDFGVGITQRAVRFNTDVTCIQTEENGANESNRTIGLEITGVTSGSIGAQSTHTLTVVDDDGPATVSYQSASVNVVEGTDNFVVTAIRGGSTSGTASALCDVVGGTLTVTTDYTFDDQTANFADGATSGTCQLDIDPGTAGGTIILGFNNLTNLPGGAVAPTQVTINVTALPPGTIQFTSSSYNVAENAGTANVTVSRTGGTSGAASVTCSTVAGGSATASPTAGFDFTTTSTVLNWANGEGGNKTCSIPITSDSTPENNETVNLQLSGVSGATLGAQSTATLTIIDDDGEGVLQFTSANFSGAESGGPITITVSRTGGTDGAVTVQFSTSNGTATAGSDYNFANGTLSWNNGEGGNKSFTVTPLPDALNEGSETVNLTLSNPTGGATLGAQSTAVLTITDSTIIPTITNISPAAGPLAGLAGVIITGTNFTGATSVTFGGTAATFVVNNSTQITVTAPPKATAGTVEVIVTTPAGSNTTTGTANDFTYTTGPTVTSISPNTGPAAGATVVTITGTNFTASGLVVKFGTVTATANFINATTIVAVAPSQSAGVVDVTVQTPGGTSPNTAADDFTYTGVAIPVVTLLTPTFGPIGTTVVITGTGFTGVTSVTFGGVAASFTVNSPTQITATVPTGTPPGSVDVRVTGPGGTSANTANDNFNNTSQAANITYTLYFRFTLIVWTGADNKSIQAALAGGTAGTNNVSGLIGAIWLFNPQTQEWGGYFPGSEGIPGANDFTTFRTGTAYFIALKSASGAPVTWTAPAN